MSNTPPDAEPLLTEAEAADLLSLSVRTLQAWRYAASGPNYRRLGRLIRYRRADLQSWIDAGASSPCPVRDAPTKPKDGSKGRVRCKPVLPPRVVELLASEISGGFAGEVRMSVASNRRLMQVLRPHETMLALSLCSKSEVLSDGTVRLVVPRNLSSSCSEQDKSKYNVVVDYDPRTGRWNSEIGAGQAGFDLMCAHVWRIMGRSGGMAARNLFALIGAAFVASLAEDNER